MVKLSKIRKMPTSLTYTRKFDKETKIRRKIQFNTYQSFLSVVKQWDKAQIEITPQLVEDWIKYRTEGYKEK
jgi:hypothetical protein